LPPLIKIFEALTPVILVIAQIFGRFIKAILPSFSVLIEKVVLPAMMFFVDFLTRYGIPIFSKIADFLGWLIPVAVKGLTDAFQSLAKILGPVYNAVIKPLFEGLMSLLGIKPIKIPVAVEFTGMDTKALNALGTGSLYSAATPTSAKIGATAAASTTASAKTIKTALKGFQTDIAKANKKYSGSVADANKKFADDSAKINAEFNKKVTEATATRDAGLVSASKDNAKAVLQIQRDFGQRMADIVAQSKARLTDAFASVAAVDVGKTFADLTTKNVTNLVAKLRTQLKSAKDLVTNAGSLASAGFSQTFIEQVVAQGPDAGNAMAKAILASTPQAQAELQGLFADSEALANTGMDALTNSLFEKSGLANQALKDMYAQAQIDLQASLDAQALLYNEQQVAIQDTFNATLTEIKASRDEALAEAEKTLNEALAAATKELNDSLDAIQKEFNAKLKEFKGQLSAHAAQIRAIKDEISAARAEAMKPITLTVIRNVVETVTPATRAVSGRIPGLAAGGYVDKPLNAIIGEAGPEVVTPLKDFERMMGLNDKKESGPTVVYYAAPNNSLDSEQALLTAMKRAKAVTAW
jgi:hypothetical protein